MKISVLMSTYNGEEYILEQLESLINQERKIDELIIIDDKSTDRTTTIIRDFINNNKLSYCTLIENSVNKGWKNNFMNGLKICTGDIIFTCDQDDIWLPFKIKEMSKILDDNREILLLASNYEKFFMSVGNRKIITMLNDGSIEKYKLDNSFMFVKRPGCVYAFRRDLVSYIDNYSFDDYPHDAFLWRTAAFMDGLYIYNRMTIRYRRHEKTATGRERKTLSNKLQKMLYYRDSLIKLNDFVNRSDVKSKESKIELISCGMKWCENRINMINNHDIILWLKNIKYISFYFNFKSYLADLYMIIRGY